jgi:hypothetical protein
MAKEKYSAKRIIEALNLTNGMIYLAAKKLGCSPVTIYNYAKRYPTVQQAIDDNRGAFVDMAELALAKAVQDGEGWAVCFTLKTIGKGRGYIERHEIEQAGDFNITVKYGNRD